MILEMKLKTYFKEDMLLYFNGKFYSSLENEPIKIFNQGIKINISIDSMRGSYVLDKTDLLLLRKINEL